MALVHVLLRGGAMAHHVVAYIETPRITLRPFHPNDIPEAVHAVVTIDHEARQLGRALTRKTSAGTSYASGPD